MVSSDTSAHPKVKTVRANNKNIVFFIVDLFNWGIQCIEFTQLKVNLFEEMQPIRRICKRSKQKLSEQHRDTHILEFKKSNSKKWAGLTVESLTAIVRIKYAHAKGGFWWHDNS
jgi:hypothetical protein